MSMCSLRWHFTNKSVTGAPCSKLSKSYSLSHSWTLWWRVRWLNQCRLEVAAELQQRRRRTDMELGHWVTGSSFTSGSSFWPSVKPEFLRFSKKCPKCKTYIWNGEMTSHCQVSVVGLKSLDVRPCSELLLLPMIIKNSLAWEYFTQVDIWSSLGL